jgi:hypothetical protein
VLDPAAFAEPLPLELDPALFAEPLPLELDPALFVEPVAAVDVVLRESAGS